MSTLTVNQPLLPSTSPSWKQRIGYGALMMVGLAGAGFSMYNISQPSEHTPATSGQVHLVGDILSGLACLALTVLAGKEAIKPRKVQVLAPAITPTTQRTDSINQDHLEQLQECIQRFDAILALISKNEEVSISLDSPVSYEYVIGEINTRLTTLESKVQHPDKEYILSCLRQAQASLSRQNSASNSTTTSPYKPLQSPSPNKSKSKINDTDMSELISKLDDVLSNITPLTPPHSPTKTNGTSEISPPITPREKSDDQ